MIKEPSQFVWGFDSTDPRLMAIKRAVDARRYGGFSLQHSVIANFPESLSAIFTVFWPAHVFSDQVTDSQFYFGFSPLFTVCGDGCDPPMYDFEFEPRGDKVFSVRAVPKVKVANSEFQIPADNRLAQWLMKK